MTHETAGDPVSGLKWTRRTTAKLADELRGLGIHVCPQTVARLLKAMGYSLRVNHKKLAGASHPNRDRQFRHITDLRERCAADNSPLISVDTKKKELVGTFRNPGAKWDRSPELVNDHDFRSDADGLAVPYGIYDPRANAGTVFVWKWQLKKGPLRPREKGPPVGSVSTSTLLRHSETAHPAPPPGTRRPRPQSRAGGSGPVRRSEFGGAPGPWDVVDGRDARVQAGPQGP